MWIGDRGPWNQTAQRPRCGHVCRHASDTGRLPALNADCCIQLHACLLDCDPYLDMRTSAQP